AIEDPDDVRMRQRSRTGGLAPEALDELVVFGEVAMQDLHRDLPAQELVLREVHVRHAPGAQARDHPVATVDDLLWRPAPRTRHPVPAHPEVSPRSPPSGWPRGRRR